MNLLSRLFSSRKPLELEDAVFGRLEFSRGAWTHIPKEKTDFMVVVFAPESGPEESQRAFFQKLSASLEATVDLARRFIHESARDIDASNLALYAIEISPPEELARGMFVVELTDANQSQIHRAEFTGGNPAVYGCDD